MRETGYYWVKYSGRWIILKWDKESQGYYFTGDVDRGTCSDTDSYISEINEIRILNPDEK